MISIILDKKTEEEIDDHLKQKNSNYHSFPFERTLNSCFQRKAQIPKFQTKMLEIEMSPTWLKKRSYGSTKKICMSSLNPEWRVVRYDNGELLQIATIRPKQQW